VIRTSSDTNFGPLLLTEYFHDIGENRQDANTVT
jgi:hypothetical protein